MRYNQTMPHASSPRIPNQFHFCYFGGQPFSLVNYLTIASARAVNQPEAMYIYMDKEPAGEWWDKAKPLVTVVTTPAPDQVFGAPIKHPAHKADVVRLQKLIEHGGIYLDLDVLCVKPFTPLLDNPLVLAEENYRGSIVGLCNAVILAEPGANFAKRWLEGFDPARSLWRGFRSQGFDQYYSELSVKYPKFLSTVYAEEIHIEPSDRFFNPSYAPESLEQFFSTTAGDYTAAYAHHLWNNAAYEAYLRDLTVQKIKTQATTFNLLARAYV